VSDGGVHSHINHLKALLEMARQKGLDRVYVHCFMDGRDTPPKSGAGYMRELVGTMREIKCGRVATISGRYWAMDRDTRWDRVRKAWEALVNGVGFKAADPVQAVEDAYLRGEMMNLSNQSSCSTGTVRSPPFPITTASFFSIFGRTGPGNYAGPSLKRNFPV
jgi:bisphosphoglycerate-independent phosphoglycerate mutase (AlkP superfamily)